MVTPEAVPFAKTGGLADVAGALPDELTSLGCDVRAVMPLYRQVDSAAHGLRRTGDPEGVPFAGQSVDCSFWQTDETEDSATWYFIDAPVYFDRDGLYTLDGKDYPDNFKRFTFFAQRALHLIRRMEWRPDVVHCHDWQTGLVAAYLKIPVATSAVDTTADIYRDIKTLYTIHNIAYQGSFPRKEFPRTGFDWSHFVPDELEFYGKLNFMKSALVFADGINTVSQRYSEEIQSGDTFGRGMQDILAWRSSDLSGIVNGIDVDDWDPRTDSAIAANFGPDDLSGKAACREALLADQGLDAIPTVPLIGMVGRLDAQKGLDLVERALEEIMLLDVRIVVLGTGDPQYHDMLDAAAKRYPGRLSVNLAFSADLARQIEAGADMFLMPSRFEPCGLNQMYSLRYGTVPIVHATGGLADTIADYDPDTEAGNGFVFDNYLPESMYYAIARAVVAFSDQTRWQRLMQRGMRQDLSWTASAEKYRQLYRRIVG